MMDPLGMRLPFTYIKNNDANNPSPARKLRKNNNNI